jgi:hypothetical protein
VRIFPASHSFCYKFLLRPLFRLYISFKLGRCFQVYTVGRFSGGELGGGWREWELSVERGRSTKLMKEVVDNLYIIPYNTIQYNTIPGYLLQATSEMSRAEPLSRDSVKAQVDETVDEEKGAPAQSRVWDGVCTVEMLREEAMPTSHPAKKDSSFDSNYCLEKCHVLRGEVLIQEIVKSNVINKAIQDIGMGRDNWKLFVLTGIG